MCAVCFCDLGGCNGFPVAVKQPPVVYQLVKWVNNLNAIKETFNFMRGLDHRPAVEKCFPAAASSPLNRHWMSQPVSFLWGR